MPGFSEFQCVKLDNLSWENICQNIVDTIGQVLRVDIVILFYDGLPQFRQQYFVYQKETLEVLELELLKLTVQLTEEIQIVNDLARDLKWQKQCQTNLQADVADKLATIRSSLSIPLINQKDLTASLTLHHCYQAHSWQPEELNIAMMMVTQAVSAIAQVRAYEGMRALAQREATINRITTAIRSSLEPQLIFNTIVQEIGQVLEVDSCILSLWTKHDRFVKCVALYNPQETRLIPQETRNWQRATISLVPIVENPILQKLIATQATVYLNDLSQHQDLARYELPWHSTSRALLIVPLVIDGEIMGSLTLRQSAKARIWCNSEIELAEAVAAQAAIAVQQARLYETTRRQAKQLQVSEQRVKQLNTYLTEAILKRFLPEAIVNKAAIGQLALDLNPEPYLVTILFCDLVGFTYLCSQLESAILAELLNEYLEAMTTAIFELGGTVDKFIGDGIMALFGAPEELSCREQAIKSIQTAKAMQVALSELNQRWQTKGILAQKKLPTLKIRCGIHQGLAVVGMFGGKQRKDYTAIGKAVNIAARLQEAAQPNSILVSEAVIDCLTNREIQEIKPKLVEPRLTDYDFESYSIPI
ncbi:MAG TPA: GAF domain-containing protein [Xenococcaceae cyanobacterium]